MVVFRIADDGAQEVLLVDQVVHRLARLDVVERRMQVIEPDHALRAVDLAGLHQLDALGLLQKRQEIVVGRLVEIDLAVDQRRHGGLRIGDPHQLDAVDARDLAAGEGRRRLAARHVVLVLEIDRLAARHPEVLGEDEGAGAD